jgi:membrane dipeptidase
MVAIAAAALLLVAQSAPVPRTAGVVHEEALVIDTHIDTPLVMLSDGFDLTLRHSEGHIDIPRMRDGGLDAAFFSVYVSPRSFEGDAAYERALAIFSVVHAVTWSYPMARVIDSAADLRAHVRRGGTGLLFGVEGAHALGTDDEETALARLRVFRSLGARYMTITWSNDNPLGHSSTGHAPEEGLTRLGRRIIREMQEIGIIVDVSHVSDQTFWDIMEISRRPLLASHSSVRALADHPRNMTDAMIRAVAAEGGAVCVNYYTSYIDVEYAAARERIRDENREAFAEVESRGLAYTARGPAYRAVALSLEPDLAVPNIETIADHIMHIVELAGPEAACLGSDFDGVPELPQGLDDVSFLPALSEALMRRGLSEEDLVMILGGNVLRVLEETE